MNIEEVNNRADYINYILYQLYSKIHPISFGDFFMESPNTGGIDAFRSLMDNLTDEGLVDRISQPGQPIPELPGRRTLDLRYSISTKGIQHLKNNGIIPESKRAASSELVQLNKDVFVTYSWDSQEHDEQVIAFTNFLRDNGFAADMDKSYSQQETAADFNKMMHQAMTDYKKVIIVLSKGYKRKAESFKGGVGNEYSLIIKDMDAHPQKYILVTFEGISDDIFPLHFKGRQIIDLSDKKNLNELFAKLKDEASIAFSAVAQKKPQVDVQKVPSFIPIAANLKILGIVAHVDNSTQLAQQYISVEFDLSLEYTNPGREVVSDYSLEVHYPLHSTGFDVIGRIEDERKIVTFDNPPKLFPSQTRILKLESIILRDSNVRQIISGSLHIKLFTDMGVVEESFPLEGLLKVKNNYGQEMLLTVDMFR